MITQLSNLYLGTCSWKYDSWKSIVYPDFGEFNYLAEYSKYFNTVEIDQWFWSLFDNTAKLPNPKTVKEYNESVNNNFLFTIKIPNSITLTHPYNKKIPNPFFLSNELMNAFLKSIEFMKDKIGMLMFQFEYLNKEKMNSLSEFKNRLETFFKKLDRNYRYGIEIRNPNYINEAFFSFLKAHDISYVFLQGYYMPQFSKVFEIAENYLNNSVIIRLHGYDRKGIEKKTNEQWNKIVEPKDDELKIIAELTKILLNKKIDVFINVNNHYEGSAPLTINKLKSLI